MGYISRNNNFKNLLAVCNVEAVSFDSELTAEIRLLLCNLSKFWQMINLKFSFNPASILSLLIAFVLSVMLSGCYTVRVYHDTDMLREKHDGEIPASVCYSQTAKSAARQKLVQPVPEVLHLSK